MEHKAWTRIDRELDFPKIGSFWKDILFITGFVYFFLLLYRPFYLGKLSSSEIIYPLHVLGYAFNTFAVAWINYVIMRRFLRPILNHWNLIKETSWNVWNFITIGLANYLFATISGVFGTGWDSLVQILWITFLVGVLPVTLRMFIRIWSLDQEINTNNDSEEVVDTADPAPITLEFPGRRLLVNPKAFLAARSIRNDLILWIMKKEGEVQTIIVRGSLKALLDQVSGQPSIMQCHRSYVVNTGEITEGHITASGGTLTLERINKTIPVSRSFASRVDPVVTRQLNSYL